MLLISWNVNGVRAALRKGFLDFVDEYNPDILCLQETKAHPDQVAPMLSDYPYQFWNWAEKKGYSGTAIFSKYQPSNVVYGIGDEEHDNEGRVITLEFEDYYLVTVYTPNAKRGLERLPYRMHWDADFLAFVNGLEKSKPVIFGGDLNVAHKEIDLANPRENIMNAGFTFQERDGFDNILDAGYLDTFREFNEVPHHYTWWSYMSGVRERNIGWRIDYFCTSSSLKEDLKDAYILPHVKGSDHCPVVLEHK